MGDRIFSSVTGTPEMAEPSSSLVTSTDHQSSTTTSNTQSSTSSLPPSKKIFSAQTTSATTSPRPSRESSPIRPELTSNSQTRSGGRSRKNSSQEPSPTRSSSATSSIPLSAAVARKAFSSSTIPQLRPNVSDIAIKAPIPQKAALPVEPRDLPRWPVSPRLRSPPPVTKALTSPRRADQEPPAINVQTSTPISIEGPSLAADGEDSLGLPGMRSPVRGPSGAGSTLETVQEISQPSTPALGLDASRELSHDAVRQVLEQNHAIDQVLSQPVKSKSNVAATESGSESGGNKGDIKMRAASLAPTSNGAPSSVAPTKSNTTGSALSRGKPSAEGSTKNMTVETETVSSIPQVAVGGGAGGAGNNGSLRAKPSSETIRPKKEKKKSGRKAPSINAGTASSKADIFEAQIASAVDEANSSDSEETFVYESNPPEMNERPRRFHSRTPSATSMASQADQRGNQRTIHGVMDGFHGVTMKKSMKFANSYNNSNAPDSTTGEDDGKGTVRSNIGTVRGSTHHHHHHHIGRWGRNGGNGHQSLFDNESPFSNATKSKLGGTTSRNSSRPTSPKISNKRTGNGKKGSPVSSGYDIDDGTGADDEITPLLESNLRPSRSGRGRRQPFSSMRQLEHQESRQDPSFLNRFAGCLVLSIMILLVISGAIGFLFATTQPLTEVKVLTLKNIVATEQELILDMVVSARNPNIVVINVIQTDIDIFAKSKHSEDDWDWWDRQQLSSHVEERRRNISRIHARDDSPDDPYEDPDETRTTLLGRVFFFDSPLIFPGSPFKHQHSSSTAQLRLAKPGGIPDTGSDNSERWQRILKYEYELILRGTLKYQLPMSSRNRNVSIDARLKVKPSSDSKKMMGASVYLD